MTSMEWSRRRVSLAAAAAAVCIAAAASPPASAVLSRTSSAQARWAGSGAQVFSAWHTAWQAHLAYGNSLWSVEATGDGDAWAVGGGTSVGTNARAYAVHWNGTAWRLMHFPDPSFVPVSVRASSRSNVWFFGYVIGGANEALRWNGTSWHAIPAPSDGFGVPVVLGRSDVWVNAGGFFNHGWKANLSHWNGQSWQIYQLPMRASLMDVAGSSGHNLWAAGIATGLRKDATVGRLVAYRWNGSQWRRASMPRRYLAGAPSLAVSASGEAWIVGTGTKRVNGASVIYYRTKGTWTQIADSKLRLTPPRVNYPPVPDGLNGIWFGNDMYWAGSGISLSRDRITGCALGIEGSDNPSFMDGIPRTHSALLAAGCPHTAAGTMQGLIAISKPR
jgi:hypothetical protein